MIQYAFKNRTCLATEWKDLGKRGTVSEFKDIIAKRFISLTRFYELAEVGRRKSECHNIYCLCAIRTIFCSTKFTTIAFSLFFPAIHIPTNAKAQLQVIPGRFSFFIMVDHHPGIFHTPLRVPGIPLNTILNGTGDLLFLFMNNRKFPLHEGLFMCESQDVGRVMHKQVANLRADGRFSRKTFAESPEGLSFNKLASKKV